MRSIEGRVRGLFPRMQTPHPPTILSYRGHLLPQGEKGSSRSYALRASAPSIIATAFASP